jgi:hypothetical protein
MFSKAEKINAPVVNRSQQNSGPAFFRKAEEESYAGEQSQSAFFSPTVQAKLTVSRPDDPQEKEADAVAEHVMRMPEPAAAPGAKKEEEIVQTKLLPGHISRSKIKGEEETAGNEAAQKSPAIQRKPEASFHPDVIQRSGRDPPAGPKHFENNLQSTKGHGHPLPESTQQFMQSRFNADFSEVRVHTGSYAEDLSNSVHAQAFTHGHDIYFNSGKYSPHTETGGTLLAHELTHTIQQGAGNVRLQRSLIDENLVAQIDFSAKAGGHQLPKGAKDYLEDYYKTDLSNIRIFSDSEIASVCSAAGIKAFTKDENIAIPPSRFDPESEKGAVLLSEQVSKSLQMRGIRSTGADGNDIGGAGSLVSSILNAIKENKAKAEAGPKGPKEATPPVETKEKKQGKTAESESKQAGKKEDGKNLKKSKRKFKDSEGISIKPVKRNPKKSPSTPAEDPAFLQVVSKTKQRTKDQKQHESAEKKSVEAQASAKAVPKEADSKAQNRKTDGLGEASKVDKPFDAAAFKADLLKKIEEITPKTLEEATEFKENNKIDGVKNAMGEKVAGEKENTTGPVNKAAQQPLQVNPADNKQPVPLPPTPGGPMPAGISASNAAPKKKLEGEISMDEQSKSLDDEMKANNVTEGQLAGSNEPSFTAALDEKKNAQKDAAEKPNEYRKEESLALKEAKAEANEKSAQTLAGMHGARGKNFEAAVTHQQTARQKDEERRATVARTIEEKFVAAEKKVNTALEDAEKLSNQIFDEGAEAARVQFENYVDRKMSEYKTRRYSGFWGGLRWAKDKLFGMPDEVDAFYSDGRDLYLKKMDEVITRVANVVTTKLNEAKQAITEGKKDIDEYVKQLPKDLQDVGKEAAASIQDKFDALEQSVNDKRDGLIDGLAKKYVDNVKKLDDRIGELKEANKGLIDKAIGFLKKVWQVIKDLVNLFTTILARLASIIGVILDSPSGFFDNLGKAFKMGFDNFKNKFLEYLELGLMEWLATNLGIKGIELPKKFDASAIFSLALQVMGITKEHIRERAVALLGERKVSLLEKAGGLIYRVYNEGLGVIWDMIVEKLTDFKELVWDAITSFIKKAIIEAALVFLLSLLNPIGAFIKVCMAIYDFLMMLVRFKDRIIELLDTILSAVTNIASGAVEAAAAMIEKAFAKSISVIIGFLAALLHLNNIFARIRDIITRIQKRVEKALDWVIMKAYSLVGKLVEGALKLEDKATELVEKGKQAVVGAGEKLLGWLGLKNDFKSKDGGEHHIFFKGNEQNAVLMVASNDPRPLEIFLQAKKDNDPAALTALGFYENIVKKQEIKVQELEIAYKDEANKDKKRAARYKHQVEVQNLRNTMKSLSDHLEKVKFDGAGGDVTLKTKITKSQHGNSAGNVTAWPLTYLPGDYVGGPPSQDPPGWKNYAQDASDQWVRGHLLSEHLHGPGSNWNLTPVSQSVNSSMASVENTVKPKIAQQGNMFYYSTTATYKDDRADPNEKNIPVSISITWGTLKKKDGSQNEFESIETHNEGPFTQGLPTLSGPPNLNSVGRDILEKKGISNGELVRDILRCRDSFMETNGGFVDYPDLLDKMVKYYANELTPKKGTYPEKYLKSGLNNNHRTILNKVFVIEKTIEIK